MDVETTALEGVLILTPKRHGDERGFFMESYNRSTFAKATGLHIEFIQDNHSRSTQGVLRGLHYQMHPHAQSKLVRVVQGEIFDVAADIRRNSPTFGQWTGTRLSSENARQLWVPAGFAHGFLVTSETAEVIYKVDAPYAPECERSIAWNDTTIGIEWPSLQQPPLVSPKDRDAPALSSADLFE
jgi:dTDP-4-dehydrorhamnose 3,5-epimerase